MSRQPWNMSERDRFESIMNQRYPGLIMALRGTSDKLSQLKAIRNLGMVGCLEHDRINPDLMRGDGEGI